MPETMTELEMLRVIEGSDPDGGETEPTEKAHAAHRRWAIDRFGVQVWERYAQGGWAPTQDW